jgi:hypothetical protein
MELECLEEEEEAPDRDVFSPSHGFLTVALLDFALYNTTIIPKQRTISSSTIITTKPSLKSPLGQIYDLFLQTRWFVWGAYALPHLPPFPIFNHPFSTNYTSGRRGGFTWGHALADGRRSRAISNQPLTYALDFWIGDPVGIDNNGQSVGAP